HPLSAGTECHGHTRPVDPARRDLPAIDSLVSRSSAPPVGDPPPTELSVRAVLPRLVAALAGGAPGRESSGSGRSTAAPCAVLVAPPGSGKTTLVPPALRAAGAGGGRRIVMLEPRRIAARAAARRIAELGGWRLGAEVGYQVRFERRASASTGILVVTEGILVQM